MTFRVDAYPTETFDGTVAQMRLQPVVVQNVTTYGTVIDVPNPQLKLKPGMTANVKVEIAQAQRRAAHAERRRCGSGRRPDVFAALNQASAARGAGRRRTRRPWRRGGRGGAAQGQRDAVGGAARQRRLRRRRRPPERGDPTSRAVGRRSSAPVAPRDVDPGGRATSGATSGRSAAVDGQGGAGSARRQAAAGDSIPRG